MTYDELTAAQDAQRTQRNFISLLGGALGVEQSLYSDDAYTANRPGQYQTVSAYGVGVEGLPVSNQQRSGAVALSMPLLLLLGVGFYLLRK